MSTAESSEELQRRTRRFKVDEVMAMVEAGIIDGDEPLELLEGELVIVSPQGPPHAGLTSVIIDRLVDFYRPEYVVREAKPLIVDDESLPEPDIAVVTPGLRELVTRHPRGDEAVLVVEAAYSSHRRDREKTRLYARGGVPVYWLLDVPARRLEVHTEPQPDGRYRMVQVLGEDDEVELPRTDVSLKVADLLL